MDAQERVTPEGWRIRVVSKPGAAIYAEQIILTDEQRERLTLGPGVRLPAPYARRLYVLRRWRERYPRRWKLRLAWAAFIGRTDRVGT